MKKLFIFLFLGMNITIYAQEISGYITDSKGQPLPNVDVFIEDLKIGTATDTNGFYKLKNLPKAKVDITFSMIGFATIHKIFEVTDNNISLNVSMQESVFNMDEVIIAAPFNKLQSENVMKIEKATINQLQLTGAPTLAEGMNIIPGVETVSTGTGIGKPVIRGLRGNRVLVYTQGIRLENQQFGDEHGLGIDENSIESVEVIKGPASLLYGSDALGGVLYLNPEKFAYQDETKIELNQNFYSNTLGSNTSLGIKSSKGRFKFIARGGFNSHADYQIPDGDQVTNTRFSEKDFKAGVGLNLDQFVTEIRYNYNQSEIGIPEGIGEQTNTRSVALPYQDLETHILSLHNHFYLKESKIDLNIGYIVNNRKEYEEEHEAHEGEEHVDEEHEGEEEAHEGPALDMNLKTLSYDL